MILILALLMMFNFSERPQQSKFIVDFSSPYLYLVGGNRGGKTEGLTRHAVIGSRVNRGEKCLLLEPTNLMSNEILLPKIDDFCKELDIPIRWQASKHKILFPAFGHSSINLYSADKPERIEGGQYWGVGIDEPAQMKKNVFQRIKTRKNSPTARTPQIFGSGTPEGFNHFYEETQKPNRRIIWGSVDEIRKNTYDGYIEDLIGEYDSLLIREKLHGEFINTTAGRVYYSFDRNNSIHVIDSYILNHDYPIIVTCDFNKNPCVWELIQYHNDHIYVFDELEVRDANTFAMCERLIDKFKQIGAYADNDFLFPGLIFYGDYSSLTARNTSASFSDYQIIDKYFDNYPGYKKRLQNNPKVQNSVNAVNNQYDKNRVSIVKICKHLIRDNEQVVWSANGVEIEKKKNAELTHSSDAFRYYVAMDFPIKKLYSSIG
jgi:hypothetical protein